MLNHKRLFVARITLVLGFAPLLAQAHEFGPDPGRTGGLGEPTCLGTGCHSSTVSVNGGPGSLKIVLPNGNSYTPGVRQRVMVQISDASRQKFGFELMARLSSGGQAGNLVPSDGLTQTICQDGSTTPCSSTFPIQYIEHTNAGYLASTSGGYTYQFDWDPPASASGNITFYAAANAGPGGTPSPNNADIYTTNVTLTPSAAAPTGPTPDPGGIVPVYSSSTTISSGAWVSIYSFGAKNLASGTTVWNGDFPQSLGGVSVSFAGKPAYLWFVSPQQINLQVPDNIGTGTVPVTIANSAGSTTVNVTVGQTSPSFLLLPDAMHATGFVYASDGTATLLGPVGSAGGARPAKRGEAVAIYATGFGPTNPPVASGQIFSGAANLAVKPTITVGGVAVNVDFGGVVGAGLYQFNFTIPQNAGSGDQAVVATAGGLQSQSNVFIPVQ